MRPMVVLMLIASGLTAALLQLRSRREIQGGFTRDVNLVNVGIANEPVSLVSPPVAIPMVEVERREENPLLEGATTVPVVVSPTSVQEERPRRKPYEPAPQEKVERNESDDRPVLDELTRSSSVLTKNEGRISFATRYELSEAPVLGIADDGTPILTTAKHRTLAAILAAEYGLGHDVEVLGELPIVLSQAEDSRDGSSNESITSLGDVRAGIRFGLAREDDEYPDVALTMQLTAPTGNSTYGKGSPTGLGHWRMHSAVSFRVTSDPVAFFGSLGAGYSWAREISGVSLRPGPNVSFSAGAALLLNDATTFYLSIAWTYTGDSHIERRPAPNSSLESGSLTVGILHRRGGGQFVDIDFSMGLTDGAPRFSIGVSWSLVERPRSTSIRPGNP